MRLAIAVAIAALGVLFFTGNAYPADLVEAAVEPIRAAKLTASVGDLRRADQTARTQTLLLSASHASPEEHATQAREILRREARARWTSVGYALAEVALKVAAGISPRGVVSSVRKLYRAALRPRSRRAAEERALARIEPEVLSGSMSPPVLALHRRLQPGHRKRAAARRVALAERALERGELPLARRQLQSARSLATLFGSVTRSHRRIERLVEAREELSRIPAPLLEDRPIRRTTLADMRLASQLLLGIGPKVGELGGSADLEPELLLASAVARYMAGDAESALRELSQLAEGDGGVAALARRALSDPKLNVSGALARARSRRRFDRALVWLGGRDLEADGRQISLAGIRAWKSALDPVNLVIGIPARVLRGDDAPADELRRAAERYLEVQRTGSERLQLQKLLKRLEAPSARGLHGGAFVDGRLDLPRARTHYVPVTAREIGVERSLLASLEPGALALASVPEEAEGAWIVPVPLAEAMPRERARRLVLGLAERLEAGDARAVGAPTGEAGERLRRLESTLDRSDLGLAIRPWWRKDSRILQDLPRGLADRGRPSARSRISTERRRRKLVVSRELTQGSRCPRNAVCLERSRAFYSQAYAVLGADGGFRLATRAQLGGLALSLELSDALPRATLSIPLGRWLRAGAWLPAGGRLGARLVIGLDGISLGPILPRPDAAFDAALAQGI